MKILITGDSMIKYLEEYLPLKILGHSLHVQAFPGSKIEQIAEKIPSLLKDFNFILFHVGTNNYKDHLQKFVNHYKNLLEKCADVPVVFSAILPRQPNFHHPPERRHQDTSDLHNTNLKFGNVNEFLSGLSFVKKNVFFCKSTNSWNGLYALDGLHLNRRGNRQLAEIFVKMLRETIPKMANDTPFAHFPPLQENIQTREDKPSFSLLYSEVAAALPRDLFSTSFNGNRECCTSQSNVQVKQAPLSLQQDSGKKTVVKQNNLQRNKKLRKVLAQSDDSKLGWVLIPQRFSKRVSKERVMLSKEREVCFNKWSLLEPEVLLDDAWGSNKGLVLKNKQSMPGNFQAPISCQKKEVTAVVPKFNLRCSMHSKPIKNLGVYTFCEKSNVVTVTSQSSYLEGSELSKPTKLKLKKKKQLML